MELLSEVEFSCDSICVFDVLSAAAACSRSACDLIVSGTVDEPVMVAVVEVPDVGAATLFA